MVTVEFEALQSYKLNDVYDDKHYNDLVRVWNEERLSNQEKDEEILIEDEVRKFVYFPVTYEHLHKMNEKAQSVFWLTGHIQMTQDLIDWNKKLDANAKTFVETILAFFAASDGIVIENLLDNFLTQVKLAEARGFYSTQAFFENIHSMTYSMMIVVLIKDVERQKHLIHAIKEIPSVQKKANWAKKWINDKNAFVLRLFAFALVEGLMFQGSFTAIFWLRKQGLMPGLCQSNEYIARDETIHYQFANELYKLMKHQIPECLAHQIMKEAVEIELEFITEAIPVSLIGMNCKLMTQYIKYHADVLLTDFGFSKIYFETNSFPWMESQNLGGKTNFFEKRVGDYGKQNNTLNVIEQVQEANIEAINNSYNDVESVDF